MPVLATNLGETMRELADALNAPYVYERSFKLSDTEALDDRFLMSFRKAHLGPDPRSVLAHICETLNVPAAYRPIIELQFPEADNIHLGFEGASNAVFYKLYLEFARRFRRSARGARESCNSSLLHLAFKWNPDHDAFRAIARYSCKPGLTVTEMQKKLAKFYMHRLEAVTHQVALSLLQEAARRMPAEEIFFLEVEEDDNPRRSFDMCVYDASFAMDEIESELAAIGRYFRIPEARLRQAFEPIRHEKLGHFAGGVGRSGKEFCTFYYGAQLHHSARTRQSDAGSC